MPIAVALIVRNIIQLLITAAVYKTAEAFISAALSSLPRTLSRHLGISEQESKDFMHDFMIDQALAFGLTIVAMRTKMPTIVAERLGFTSRGFNKFGFSKTARTAIEGKIGGRIPIDLAKGTSYWKMLGKFMGAVTAIFMLTQSIEVFAYRPQFFVNILNLFGLGKVSSRLLVPAPKPLFHDTEIQKITDGFISQYGPGFNDEELQVTWRVDTDFTKLMLEAATDAVFAEQKLPTQANVIKALREVVLPPKLRSSNFLASTEKTASRTAAVPSWKVFTGVVSQGILGSTEAFTPREDDLITSTEDLRIAAQNNLAAFQLALPGRIVYEIKVINSVTGADGLTRHGSTQRVVSGHKADGTPRFKLVRNKFAVADVYILTQRGGRSKVQQIVFGPTDAATFNPDVTALADLGTAMRSELITRNIEEVVTVSAAPPAPAVSDIKERFERGGMREVGLEKMDEIEARAADPGATIPTITAPFGKSDGWNLGDPALNRIIEQKVAVLQELRANGIELSFPNAARRLNAPGLASPAETITAGGPQEVTSQMRENALAAHNLSEWYGALGQQLPKIEERAKVYESHGLGPAGWYTGTAEQNLKLLTEFKRRAAGSI